jgi:Arc/MetJ family transcription regulator
MKTIKEKTRVIQKPEITLDDLVTAKIIAEKIGKNIKKYLLTHKQMVNKMLKNSAVKAEVDKLNREEFAILDEILAARKES